MPRSATDATRFTSTTPHVSAKPPPGGIPLKSLPNRTPGPKGETPQEKVRRLRAAADRARNAEVSTFDKIIVRGRAWADRAHRITALSLIAATFIAGGVTVYALGDMMIHNRRKRAEFFAEQKALHTSAMQNAQRALEFGTATEDQIAFLSREREHDAQVAALEKTKAEKKGIFKRGKEWLFSGLKKEEEGEDVGTSERRLGYEGLSEEDDTLGERESDIVRAIEEKKMAISEKVKQAFENEKEKQRTGGPLDRLGTAPKDGASEEQPKAGGWTSFMTRR
ncbi:hypothetical protein G7Y89_g14529 [Cudoniella acicularis]|uniref:Uncharacterized protein n=1 Tax=Cudoniella acicularis TaxID=354080 RepID=A0A8H4R1B0_9HELO|nr:hypothetical protein G7Y89_g14529 [Cudoniella acicularis]